MLPAQIEESFFEVVPPWKIRGVFILHGVFVSEQISLWTNIDIDTHIDFSLSAIYRKLWYVKTI